MPQPPRRHPTPAAPVSPPGAAAVDSGPARTPHARRCPHCHAALMPYQGTNPHKVGSWECGACQTRVAGED